MKYTTLLVFATLLFVALQTTAQTPSEKSAQALSEYFAKAHSKRLKFLEEGKIKAALDCYADHAYLLDIGATLKGKKAIEEHLILITKTMTLKNTKNVQEDVEICGDMAYDYGTTTMELHYTFTDDMEAVRSKYIAIWKKNDAGQWKIVKLIFNQEG